MITALDKNTALVLIDLQKGIVKMNTVHPISEILKNSGILVDAFRKANLPIVPVNVIPVPRNVRTALGVSLSISNFPADFAEIVAEIKTQDTDIFITKNTWNAFYDTNLHEELQKRNVTGIVLLGVSTSIGVEGTARAAAELGYNISFVIDAITDMSPDAHQNSINLIYPRIGELGTTEEILEKLSDRN